MELHGMDKDAKQKRINGDNIIEEWIQSKLDHPETGGMPEADLADLMTQLITDVMGKQLHMKLKRLNEIHEENVVAFFAIMNDPTADKKRADMLAEKSELLAEIALKLQEHEKEEAKRSKQVDAEKDEEALEWFRKMEDKKKKRESGMRLLTERFIDRYIPKTPQPPDDGVLGWDHADNVDDTDDDTDDIIVRKFRINRGGSNSKTRNTRNTRTRRRTIRSTRTRRSTIRRRTTRRRTTRRRTTRRRTRKTNKRGRSMRH
jgi:hypothetical protein